MRSAVNRELIMKRLIYLSCLVMLFGLFGPRLGSAQSSAGVEGLLDKINRLPGMERQQKLVEGARKEGELVWYSTMNRENSQELINLFEKEHPYLRVKLLNGSAVQTMGRESLLFFFGAGLIALSAQIANFIALSRADVSVIIPLLNTTPLFAVLFSSFFLRSMETITPRILLGAILMVAGVVIITSR